MNFLRELLDVAAHPEDTPDAPPPCPAGKIRVHVFSGHFDTEESLLSYCFDAPEPDATEPFNSDQPGAYIDSTYIATGYRLTVSEALADFFDPSVSADLYRRIGDHNGVVIVSEHAFGGMPYTLNDTPKLHYHGHWLVDLP